MTTTLGGTAGLSSSERGVAGRANRRARQVNNCIALPTSVLLAVVGLWTIPIGLASEPTPIEDLLAGRFRWTAGPPILTPAKSADNTFHSVKDPSIVQHGGGWHPVQPVEQTAAAS